MRRGELTSDVDMVAGASVTTNVLHRLVLARVRTLEGAGRGDVARAVALWRDRVVALKEVPAHRTVDLGGAVVTPGLHDGHNHMAWHGLALSEVDGQGAAGAVRAGQGGRGGREAAGGVVHCRWDRDAGRCGDDDAVGCEGAVVGSGILKAGSPARRAEAIVKATTFHDDPDMVANASGGPSEAMVGIESTRSD